MPIFNGYDNGCLSQALQYITNLVTHGKVFKIVDLSEMTRSQRGYLHICIGIAAKELGVRPELVKQEYYKKLANPDIFLITDYDPVTKKWTSSCKSSEEIKKEELAVSIERFRNWLLTSELLPFPIYTPAPDDRKGRAKAYIEVERYNKLYGYAK